ncbi:GUN1-INTERACTING PROTEIN 1 [Hibiscus trionum]|uniref:GUN1-INTERACTING PROTEIN 1 n=1 Tax=Hibiscus trionum TaxID=183268 RepID=A0A9W7H5D1_HIBTR|nr:GUN1-INTERACTING PROTEIN 1 [Hibiscus trionum]
MSSFGNAANFDSLLLQTLLGRLQIRPPSTDSFLTQSLEDLLLASDSDPDDSEKTLLAKEESRLEKEIIRIVLSGKTDPLKPNSGQAVTINDHHICISFHEEKGSDYRVWEWHGHIMLFDEEDGYTPEYIYGNYFERLQGKPLVPRVEEEKEDEVEETVVTSGLRELIVGDADAGRGRILHRNINAGSPRFI